MKITTAPVSVNTIPSVIVEIRISLVFTPATRNRRTDLTAGPPPEKMGIFLTPVPPKPLKADERLCRLRQGGRPLERYVEEFLEVSNLVSWTDACINVVFLMGLDKDVIRYNEPACNFSLVDSLNSILLLNGSNFEVDEIQKNQSPCPAPSATYRASPAHLTPEPCTYRFNGPAYAWPPVATKPSAPAAAEPSGPAYAWPPVATKPSAPAAAEPSGPAYSRPPVAAEPSAPAAAVEQASPISTEPSPVPVGILIIFEGMDWTSLPASPVSAAGPASPVSAAGPASPVSAAEPASPVSAAEPSAPVSAAKPSAPVSAAEPSAPVSAAEPSAPVSAAEPSSSPHPRTSAAEPSAPVSAAEPASPVSAAEPASPVSAAEPASPRRACISSLRRRACISSLRRRACISSLRRRACISSPSRACSCPLRALSSPRVHSSPWSHQDFPKPPKVFFGGGPDTRGWGTCGRHTCGWASYTAMAAHVP
ncbi:Opioid growth factor receptor [Anabarilius grahami]|uniref:Opioid growth factor receptor n=1 Tax=Anabarilius grahami TaxID=495550 RepID=A0A3N0YYA3_ANAGA|nr:Opioid growth factor receptor [Anabarilius grahami]